MVVQEPFGVEKFMDQHENSTKYNLGETCCYSLSLQELAELSNTNPPLDQITQQRLTYGWIKGSEELKRTILSLYNDDFFSDISPEDIVISNGAIGANFLSLYSLAGKGDHVIAVNPTYQQLHSVPKIFGATVDLLNLSYDESFQPDLEQLSKLVKPNTKLIIINNPNNPTGVVIPNSTLKSIVEIAKSVNAYLLCDEVYRPLFHSLPTSNPQYKEQPRSIVQLYEKGISTSSISKAFSFAGLRIGWIVSRDKDFVENCWTKRDYNTISISMVDDILANYVLNNRKFILKRNYELCIKNLQLLDDFISESHGLLNWIRPQGGTTALIKVNGVRDTFEFATELAEKYGILIVPGEVFNNPGFLRVGFANSSKDLTEGLAELKKVFIDKHLWK